MSTPLTDFIKVTRCPKGAKTRTAERYTLHRKDCVTNPYRARFMHRLNEREYEVFVENAHRYGPRKYLVCKRCCPTLLEETHA